MRFFNAGAALLSGLALAALTMTGAAQAQTTYPNKNVRIIVPFTAGGGTDLIARSVAQKLQETLGQNVIVENRGGAAGNIGTDLVAKAAPDGYTLLLGYSSNFSISPFLYPDLPYKPLTDFEPISLVAIATNILVAHPSIKATTLKELQTAAKGRPVKLNYSSAGTGTIGHLTIELFKSVAGVDLMHVPYKGAASAISDLLAGRVEVYAGSPAVLMPYVRSGDLKALGVSSAQRETLMNDIPTFIEQGFQVEALAWFGLLAPAGTPKDVIQKVNAALVKSLKGADVTEAFGRIGYNVQTDTPEEFSTLIKADYEKWKKVVSTLGIKAE